MNFREYITESENEFAENTLEELEILLAHHLNDATEYKGTDVTAYEATLKDIKAIKAAIKKLKSEPSKNEKKKPVTSGNQDLGSADTISIGGSGNMAAASPDSVGAGQGNAE